MDKIALIDADSLLYYEMGKPTLEEAMEGIDIRIEQILNFVGADKYIGFLTLGRCFRYEISTIRPYKYNRSGGAPKPPIFYALKEYVKQKWRFSGIKELEADDLVAFYQNALGKENTVICSPDKDVLKQISGNHFNYGKMDYVNTTKEEANEFLLIQILMGDSTDGIPGLPKVGPKTATKWVKEDPSLKMVIDKYVEKFGIHEGINNFAETFNLVYLLRTPEEVLKTVNLELTPLELNTIGETIDKDDSDW